MGHTRRACPHKRQTTGGAANSPPTDTRREPAQSERAVNEIESQSEEGNEVVETPAAPLTNENIVVDEQVAGSSSPNVEKEPSQLQSESEPVSQDSAGAAPAPIVESRSGSEAGPMMTDSQEGLSECESETGSAPSQGGEEDVYTELTSFLNEWKANRCVKLFSRS